MLSKDRLKASYKDYSEFPVRGTSICRICGKTREWRKPKGKIPIICQPLPGELQSDCQREVNRVRSRRYRQLQKKMKD